MSKYTRRSAQQWQGLVEQHQYSQLSVSEFCRQQDIGYASFCQWRKRLRDSPPVASASLPAFLAVEPPAQQPPSGSQWLVELQICPDMVLRIGKA